MMFSRGCVLVAAILLALVRPIAQGATDPEIDRLLKKLPPPEKLVKADDRVLRVNDPAMRDPLVKEILAENQAKNLKRSLELSQQLASRYPTSAAAHAYCGLFFYYQTRYPEAIAAFRKAIALQPNFVLCHYCVASAEWHQHNYNAALDHMRKVTKLEPRAAAGWALLSMCAEVVGAWQESVTAARRLVSLEPRQTAAWVRLALAEKNVGNYPAAVDAWNHAVATQRAKKSSAAQKSAPQKKKG